MYINVKAARSGKEIPKKQFDCCVNDLKSRGTIGVSGGKAKRK